MQFRKVISVFIGFASIALLSSLFAKIQGTIFPSSLEIFSSRELIPMNNNQLVLKICCVLVSCLIGGIITTGIGGRVKENLIVAGGITAVVGWMWFAITDPMWFWAVLILGVLPAIYLGYKMTSLFHFKSRKLFG